MRKYKQVKEKKITYSLDEWAIIEERAALAMMRTGTFIRNISLNGQVNIYSVSDISQLMNALRIIGNNINQIAKKANETHSLYQECYDIIDMSVRKNIENPTSKWYDVNNDSNTYDERQDFLWIL